MTTVGVSLTDHPNVPTDSDFVQNSSTADELLSIDWELIDWIVSHEQGLTPRLYDFICFTFHDVSSYF